MARLPKSIQTTIDEIAKLPGIGPKSAARITFYLLTKHNDDVRSLSAALSNLKENLKICSVCYNYGEDNPCEICSDNERDQDLICIVEEPLDVIAIDRTGYIGMFHVLGGVISPINGIGPDDIRIGELLKRVKKNSDKIKEVILATNPSLEGEATAAYISDRIKPLGIKVTRLARGLPVGGDLEYADELTLSRSIEGRKEMDE